MKNVMRFLRAVFLPGVMAACAVTDGAAAEPVAFNREVRPILNNVCFKCHGGVKEAGGLNLQFREQALGAGKSGARAIVPGHPEQSEFIARLVTEDEDERMPKDHAPLSAAQIDVLKRWIAEGAQWEEHWAYIPPAAVEQERPIDELIEEKLRADGLAFSPEAGRRTFARRVALDLTGLPPSVAMLEGFVADDSPEAKEKLVDALLASPAYGERWAAVWLDLARYADSKGYEADRFRDMWRYRDWVIDAFNRDQPYDEFLRDQFAGDLLPEAADEQLIATAFHRNTLANDEGGTDDEEFRSFAIIDRVNTTFDAVLGTTIGCVQCHGHPYDPFVHEDYYRLYAFFNTTADADRNDDAPTRKFTARADRDRAAQIDDNLAKKETELRTELAREEHRRALEAWLEKASDKETAAALPKPVQEALAKPIDQRDANTRALLERHYFTAGPDAARFAPVALLYQQRDTLRQRRAAIPECQLPVMQELPPEKTRKTQVFIRGNWLDKGKEVTPATPAILGHWHDAYPRNRLGFAQWLTNGGHPLTARVHVNRVWEQLFGLGLVETLEDFGSQGDVPIYQEVLDSLARRFQGEWGWSQKKLLREIVLSRVYGQSSKTTAAHYERDPANRRLARGPRFRLTSEQLRDQALQAAGLLNRKSFGPPVMPYQPPGVWLTPYEGSDWKTSTGDEAGRRALYTFIRRSATYPSMVTFDAPNREFCQTRRLRTNTPLQALDLLNSPVFAEAHSGLARRMKQAAPDDVDAQLRHGFYLVLLHWPAAEELAALRALYEKTNGDLTAIATALLNLDEALTKN